MKELPLYSEDLIKELDQLIPEKCPDISETIDDIRMYAGSRLLVRSLLARMEFTKQQSDKRILRSA